MNYAGFMPTLRGGTASLAVEQRRAFPRRPAKGTVTLRTGPAAMARGIYGRLVDISSAGVGILVGRELVPGTTVELEMQGVGSAKGFTVAAEVRFTQVAQGGAYRVGLRFLHRLLERELADLVR